MAKFKAAVVRDRGPTAPCLAVPRHCACAKLLSNGLTAAGEEEKAGAANPGGSKMARDDEMQEFTRSFFRGRPDLRCTGD